MSVPLGPNKALRYDCATRALRAADVHPKRILEIGCGQGAFAVRLARLGSDGGDGGYAGPVTYLGIEPDSQSCTVAQRRLDEVGAGEVRNIDFADIDPEEQFDLVCAFEVLEHMADDDATMKAWAGLVAPGGLLLLSTPGYQARYSAYDEYVGHYRRYEPDDLVALFAHNGLVDTQVWHYGFPLYNFTEYLYKQVARLRLARAAVGETVADRTAASGRVSVAPPGLLSAATIAGRPFQLIQRWFADRGPGLMAFGRKPL